MDDPMLNNKHVFDIRTFNNETLEDLLLVGLIHKDFSARVTVDVLDQMTTSISVQTFLLAVDWPNMLETQSVHKYDDKVMAADWFMVPSAIEGTST